MKKDRSSPPRSGVIPGREAIEGDGPTNGSALKKIPLTLTVRKEFDHFNEFVGEFGNHLYPEGMFIPSERPKPKGSAVRIDFRMRDGFQILLATGEVIRADSALPGALNGMWVSFRVLDPDQAALIRRIVDQREAAITPARGTPIPAIAKAGTTTGDSSTDASMQASADASTIPIPPIAAIEPAEPVEILDLAELADSGDLVELPADPPVVAAQGTSGGDGGAGPEG